MTTAREDTTRLNPMADMGARCMNCPGTSFRRSRLKVKDLSSLLLLQYPVRCMSCSQRQRVSLAVAHRAVSSRVRQVRASAGETPWSGWGSTDGAAERKAPSPVSGSGFTALPVRAPVKMPELHGIRLEHQTLLPESEEALLNRRAG